MNTLLSFYESSIGKKVLMSLTGLFLCVFLLEHLVGNLLLFMGEHVFNTYSEIMVSNPVIRTIEIFLFLALLLHPFLGLLVWMKNRRTRPKNYSVYKLNENSPLASRITMLTGSIIFIFLIIHLRTFFVPTRFGDTHASPYKLVTEAFSNGWYSGFYIVALILLAYHLRHGFQSAFQTLGWRHKKFETLLDVFAFIFWFLIPLGFATIPLYFYLFHQSVALTVTGVN